MKSFMQKIAKGDKSDAPEGWPDDVEQLEQQVEELRKVCTDISKRISSGLYSGGISDVDKKIKKIPLNSLASTLRDSGDRLLPLSKMIGTVMKKAGQTLSELADQTCHMEIEMEAEVISPLRRAADEDLYSIQRQRKHLGKLSMELKSARERLRNYEQQQESALSGGASGGHSLTQVQGKLNQASMQMEDADREVFLSKDAMLKDFYMFEAKDSTYATYMLHLLRKQADYHSRCLDILNLRIPEVEKTIASEQLSKTYEVPLSIHLAETNREIAFVLEECVKALDNHYALQEEGLFRIAGSKNKIDLVKSSLNVMRADVLRDVEPAVVADALKQYFRYLPEPLLTFDLYRDWVQATKRASTGDLSELESCCNRLPSDHRENLAYLMRFLAKVARYEPVNKMGASNLAIVFGPNLLRPPSNNDGNLMQDTLNSMLGPSTVVVEMLIAHAEELFPGDLFSESVDFSKESIHSLNGEFVADVTQETSPPLNASAGSSANSTGASGPSASPSIRRRGRKAAPPPPPPAPPTQRHVSPPAPPTQTYASPPDLPTQSYAPPPSPPAQSHVPPPAPPTQSHVSPANELVTDFCVAESQPGNNAPSLKPTKAKAPIEGSVQVRAKAGPPIPTRPITMLNVSTESQHSAPEGPNSGPSQAPAKPPPPPPVMKQGPPRPTTMPPPAPAPASQTADVGGYPIGLPIPSASRPSAPVQPDNRLVRSGGPPHPPPPAPSSRVAAPAPGSPDSPGFEDTYL